MQTQSLNIGLWEMQHATTTDGALEMYPGAGIANIGIMLFRSSAKIFAEVLPTLLWQQPISSTSCVENSQLWKHTSHTPLL